VNIRIDVAPHEIKDVILLSREFQDIISLNYQDVKTYNMDVFTNIFILENANK